MVITQAYRWHGLCPAPPCRSTTEPALKTVHPDQLHGRKNYDRWQCQCSRLCGDPAVSKVLYEPLRLAFLTQPPGVTLSRTDLSWKQL